MCRPYCMEFDRIEMIDSLIRPDDALDSLNCFLSADDDYDLVFPKTHCLLHLTHPYYSPLILLLFFLSLVCHSQCDFPGPYLQSYYSPSFSLLWLSIYNWFPFYLLLTRHPMLCPHSYSIQTFLHLPGPQS